MKQPVPQKGESTKIAAVDESNMTAGLPKIDESISETSLPAPPVPPKGESTKIAPVDESNMTINKTCDMTAGIGLQGMPESSFEETMDTSEWNTTAEVAPAQDRTMDVTSGIGCQMTYIDSSMDESMAATTMTKLPTPKQPRSERMQNDLEVKTNAEKVETKAEDARLVKNIECACPETYSSEYPSDSMSEEGSTRVHENEAVEEASQESKDGKATEKSEEQLSVTLELKALPKPVSSPEKQGLPKPVSPKKPESSEADSDVVEMEIPSTASMYEVDEDAEASTLDEGSLTPDPVVDLLSPDRTADDYSVIILDDTVAEGSAERKKTKAARKLDMTPPTSPDRLSKLAMETSPKKLSSPGKDPSEEKNTTDMSMSPEKFDELRKEASTSEAKDEKSEKKPTYPLPKTWKDEFGHDVPYLRNDPRRPKNEWEIMEEEDEKELRELIKTDSEGEAERDAL
ncbi:Oidioi.mRNA.OKI2018_I69.XSR.g13505.t1.cds [Oikopleura dioica]|uniref:Oidioi.mRNA.OKI2018_I69.XSR.g13505.t1.cds n=1 Tax=Oikopleura dioica TaxID=34765 RepID=A0ABN7SBS6_OIKDI|nr:Oidioi.mRNA.OKI2018_I69.XSR.g13505.t1.cds [Oikopleura dioica]